MKVLLVGDTHGEISAITHSCEIAHHFGCELIIQLGDFGFMFDEDRTHLVNTILADYNMNLWHIDGNHENFDLMESNGLSISGTKPIQYRDFLTYLPRGSTFTLANSRCMAFGGASSIDKRCRSNSIDWWPQELITQEQIDAIESKEIYYLFTHDCPGHPTKLMNALEGNSWNKDGEYYPEIQISYNQRQMLLDLVNKVNPRFVYHGHYHYSYTDRVDNTIVIGLGCYGMNRYCAIVEVD